VTGSYDCTAKIWGKQSLTDITLLHTISLHNDSVWDLKLKGETLVTGGLDGAIGIFTLSNGNLTTNHFFKATDALVAAVDFNDDILITGFEDALIALWTLNDARELRRVSGHTAGITGIKINGNLFASSSYDGSVCLWTLDGNRITVFNEPSHLLRCIGFSGNTVVSGDFGGYLHFWEIEIANPATPVPGCVKIKKYHAAPSHKSHIVCIQQNARRIVSGSRDKTVLVQDFWANVSKMRSL
jgi:WD40 repeat protein